jgi:hypothetical protein
LFLCQFGMARRQHLHLDQACQRGPRYFSESVAADLFDRKG